MTATLPPRIQVTDGDLVIRARAGDQSAFDKLYTRHLSAVTGVCTSRVSSGDVDDMVQDSFVKAWQKIDQLGEPDAFGAWVRAIAARRCIDLHRGSGRNTFATNEIDEAAVIASGSDELLLRREAADRVHQNLSTLPERDREALFLRDGMEASITELADRYNLSEGSTRVMLTRARKKLRASWAAVIAWLVGMRAMRNIGQISPQMVAAGAIVVAAPLLLGTIVVPTLLADTPDAGKVATSITSPVDATTKDAAPAADSAPDDTSLDQPAAPAANAPAADAGDTSPAEPSAETVINAPVVEDDLRLERQEAEDNGEAVETDVKVGDTGDNDVQVFAGTVDDFVQEVTGTGGGGDESDTDPQPAGSDPCLVACG